MYKLIFPLTLGAFMLGACEDDTKDTAGADTGDAAVEDCYVETDVSINDVSDPTMAYDAGSGSWYYYIDANGWADDAYVDIYQDAGGYVWEETHELVNTDWDDCGTWDWWDIELPVVTDFNDQTDSVNTLYDDTMIGLNSWMFHVWVGTAMVDCWVYDVAGNNYFDGMGCSEH